MNIVAIGGGEIRLRETLEIDTFIRDLSGKSAPKLLFIPTASNDAAGYCDVIEDVYGKTLGCSVAHLKLTADPSQDEVENKILDADIVYVGGGNTKSMLEQWQQYRVDHLIKQAAQSGTILSGLSAGAICWFDKGHSDYESFDEKNKSWQYRLLDGLAMQTGVYCPHLNEEKRLLLFTKLLEKQKLDGIGCENNAAIWYQNDHAQVVTSQAQAAVKLIQASQSETRCDVYYHGETIPHLALEATKR